MKNVIVKYKLNFGPNEHIVPLGSQVVHFNIDPKTSSLAVWLTHAPASERPMMVQARMDVIPSGVEYDTMIWEHFGTVVTPDGWAWHLLTERVPSSGKSQFNERAESYVRPTTTQ